MKLRGTMTEQSYRNQLQRWNRYLFEDLNGKRILSVIRGLFGDFKAAYIIDWIPEQGEDIYSVLVDNKTIAFIELDRYDYEVEPIVSEMSLFQYQKGQSKTKQILLAVAIDLIAKDMTE